jgi:hypothetical protein
MVKLVYSNWASVCGVAKNGTERVRFERRARGLPVPSPADLSTTLSVFAPCVTSERTTKTAKVEFG